MVSKFFIERPRFAVVCSIVLVFAGLVSWRTLSVEEYPNIAPPQCYVWCNYPGAGAQTVNDVVAINLENQFNSLDNLLYIQANAEENGNYYATLSFEVGTDESIDLVNVLNAEKRAEPFLPEEVVRQGIICNKRSTDILCMYAFQDKSGILAKNDLSHFVKNTLGDEIIRIPGVSAFDMFGGAYYCMRLWLDPVRMNSLGVTVQEINAAVQSQNMQATAGTFGSEGANDYVQFKIDAMGRLSTPEQFAQIVLRADADGNILHLGDVCRPELGNHAYSSKGDFNGSTCISLMVYRDTTANSVATVREVNKLIESFKPRMPEGVECSVGFDPTESIVQSMKEIIYTLLITLVLVVAITYLFLQDWRATLVPAIAIPVSLIGTFTFMQALGYSINTLTLFGLVLVIGSLVDDAIVVVENTQSLMAREHLNAHDAAVKSMSQISSAIIATTLVTLACYVPLAFYGGMVGIIYKQFSVTMCIALVLSTCVALSLSPALCALLMKPPREKPSLIFAPFNFVVDLSRRFSNTVMGFLVRRSALSLLVILAFFAGIYVLGKKVPSAFLGMEDKGVVMCDINLPPGASLNRTYDTACRFRDLISGLPETRATTVVAGFGLLNGAGENNATVFLNLKHWDDRKGPESTAAKITGVAQNFGNTIPDARITCFAPPPIPGFGATSGLSFYVSTDGTIDAAALGTLAAQVVGEVNKIEGVRFGMTTFTANNPQLYLDIDREKAATLGINMNSLFFTLQAQLASYYINDFNYLGQSFYVKMQSDKENRGTLDSILEMQVPNDKGELIPLSVIASIKHTFGPRLIQRYNKQMGAKMQVELNPGVPTGPVMEKIEQIKLPKGCSVQWTDLSLQEKRNQGQITGLMIMAVFFAYLFLVAQYESWTIPLSVMLTVSSAVVGALLGLFITDLPLTIYAQLGLVMLIGLSAKNAILMVEFSKAERESGVPITQSAINGFNMRYRAVLMTAWSFLFGVIPLLFATGAGANSRHAIGVTTFAGMLFATIVGVIITPSLYAVFEHIREGIKVKLFGYSREKAANIASATSILVLMLGIGVFATGCSTTHAAREAQANNTERTIRFEELGLSTAEPIDLQRLEEAALVASPTLAQARAQVVLAQIAVRDIDASFIPVVDANAGYTYASSNRDPHDTQWSGDGTFRAGLSLNWLLYDFGRTKASTRRAIAALAAAEQSEREAAVATVYGVRSAAFELEKANAMRKVSEETASSYEEHLRQTRDRHDVGAATAYDVSKATVDRDNALLSLIAASNSVANARASLNLALGLAENPEYEVSIPAFPAFDALEVADLMAIAATNSPALAALSASAEAAKAYVDYTICNLYPSISLGLTLDASGDSTPLLWNYAAVGNVAQSLFNAGAKNRRIEEAVANMRIARSRLAACEQQVYNALLTAKLECVRAAQSLEVAKSAAAAAQENFDIVSSRFEVGQASALERTDAQVSLTAAKAAVVSADFAYRATQILIAKLLGR